MSSLKPMLFTALKTYDRSQFVKDVTAGIIVAVIALASVHRPGFSIRCRPGGWYFYCHCGRFRDLRPGRQQRADRRSDGGICHHRGWYRGKRRHGWSGDRHRFGRCVPDSYGRVPFWKPDQVHSIIPLPPVLPLVLQ